MKKLLLVLGAVVALTGQASADEYIQEKWDSLDTIISTTDDKLIEGADLAITMQCLGLATVSPIQFGVPFDFTDEEHRRARTSFCEMAVKINMFPKSQASIDRKDFVHEACTGFAKFDRFVDQLCQRYLGYE